jgi:hypothetical protein
MDEALLLRLAALKVLSAHVAAEYEDARAKAAAEMHRGDRVIARSPLDDAKIGAVSMSDPKAAATVTDSAALLEWMAEHYPDTVTTGYEVAASDHELVGLLFEHAPHLLRRVRKLDPKAVAEIRRYSAAVGTPIGPSGEADIPGVTVTIPAPVVSCRPDESTALPAVIALVRAGRLGLDGSLRELEANA